MSTDTPETKQDPEQVQTAEQTATTEQAIAEQPQEQLPTVAPAKPPATIGAGDRGLELLNMSDMWRFACAVFEGGLSPKGFNNPQAILVALQLGAEVGIPPMATLQNVCVINNRPSLFGDIPLALVRNCGHFDEEAFEEGFRGQGETFEAYCIVRRLPRGKPIERTFGHRDAAQANLLNKEGPWRGYPKRMMQMRARTWALRDAFPDVLKGVPIAEEQYGSEPTAPPTSPLPASVSRTALLTDRLVNGSPLPPVSEAQAHAAAVGLAVASGLIKPGPDGQPIAAQPPATSPPVASPAASPADDLDPAKEEAAFMKRIANAPNIVNVNSILDELDSCPWAGDAARQRIVLAGNARKADLANSRRKGR